MPMTVSVFIATSLDGFIAREDGAIDWLMEANAGVPAGEDCGYSVFMQGVDVLVMGSGTYEQVCRFEPWPYEGKRVIVLTSRSIQLRSGTGIRLESGSGSPKALLKRLADEGHRRAYVDGGRVIQSFLREGLVDDLTITTIPVLLGSGRRLFGTLPGDVHLQLSGHRTYGFGFVQATYRVLRHPSTSARSNLGEPGP